MKVTAHLDGNGWAAVAFRGATPNVVTIVDARLLHTSRIERSSAVIHDPAFVTALPKGTAGWLSEADQYAEYDGPVIGALIMTGWDEMFAVGPFDGTANLRRFWDQPWNKFAKIDGLLFIPAPATTGGSR